MRLPQSLQWRIALAYTTLIFVTMGIVSFYLIGFVRDTYITNLQNRLANEAELVGETSSRFFNAIPDLVNLQASSERTGELVDGRVTIFALDGSVLADSWSDASLVDSQIASAEIQGALNTGLGVNTDHSDIANAEILYTAVPVIRDGEVVGVARVGVPTSQIQQNVNRIILTITISALVVALLSIGLGYYMVQRTSRAVQTVAEGARLLAQGNLEHQVQALSADDDTQELADAFNGMAATIRRMVRDLSGERNTLTAILDTMADGVVVIDREGEITLMNRAAEWLLDVPARNALGGTLVEVVRDHEMQELVSNSMSTRQMRQDEIELLHMRRFISAIATPLGDFGREGVLLTLHDLTRIRQVETTRKEFVSNVSHELRSPLTSIKAMVETLEDGALEDESVARDFLRRINRDVDRMNSMVNDLLELSRLESGQEMLNISPVDLRALLEEVAYEHQYAAQAKDINLHAELPEGVPLVLGESDKLRQVVDNLLENALKHTPEKGDICITTASKGRFQEVCVRDSGPGIPHEHLPHVFERFYKVDRSRRDGGTGLGLAIVKHIVQAHNGDLDVESQVGVGSTFKFTIPTAV